MLSPVELLIGIVELGGELRGIGGIVLTQQSICHCLEHQKIIGCPTIIEISQGLRDAL
jgi:hypothetical protein